VHTLIVADVLFTEHGHVRLSDFGLAKRMMRGRANSRSGSLPYLSPELLLSADGDHGLPSDWWALGVLIYIMAMFTTPFVGSTGPELMSNIKSADVQPDFEALRARGLSAHCVDLVAALLAKDPDARLDGTSIRSHPFLADVDWHALESSSPDAQPLAPPVVTDVARDTAERTAMLGDTFAGSVPDSMMPSGNNVAPTRVPELDSIRFSSNYANELGRPPSEPAPVPPSLEQRLIAAHELIAELRQQVADRDALIAKLRSQIDK
jgi:serine/threonine protein kinase